MKLKGKVTKVKIQAVDPANNQPAPIKVKITRKSPWDRFR